jgi:2-keto-4-pentenoate hydratase/2-oxohepta-3-ene-1,7-dioic acid hydratase in catechol pathway
MRYVQLEGMGLGAQVGGDTVSLAGELGGINTLDDLVAAGPAAWQGAAELASRMPVVTGAKLSAPLSRPSKIVCVGLNYRDHALEQGIELPSVPLIFAKFPSAIIGPDQAITWAEGSTEQVDFEVELAVVVGQPLRRVSAAEALAGVFGYTIANDVSARDMQFADGQWVRGKSLDTFLPLGPHVVTADELGDPGQLRVATRVNGLTMQDSSTDQLIFGVGELLSFLSDNLSLLPGDVVLTGTPAGVGAFRDPPVFLKPGDVVEVEIDAIGVLRNPVGSVVPTASGAVVA